MDILLNSADGKGVAAERLDSWTIHGGLNLHDAISYGLTNLPPLADAGSDQTVPDNDRDGTELVTLDGSASSDRDGSIVSYEWREGNTPIATGATPAVWLSVGTHTLTLEVTDDDGDSATDSVVVAVNPANQVAVTASAAQGKRGRPNRRPVHRQSYWRYERSSDGSLHGRRNRACRDGLRGPSGCCHHRGGVLHRRSYV